MQLLKLNLYRESLSGAVADLGLNFWVGTNDVGGLISGCGQLSLHMKVKILKI